MDSITHRFTAMASACAVHLVGSDPDAMGAIADAAEVEVRRIEARYSRYREDSELSRVNRVAAAGGSTTIDPETHALVAFAQALHARSEGAFDITSGLLRSVWDFKQGRVPSEGEAEALLPRIGLDKLALGPSEITFSVPGMALDFGGIGKEYAADRAAELCRDLGASHGFVDLAGDIRIIGPQPDGQPWRIGIRDPLNRDGLVTEIELADGAMATSGDYERFIEVEGRRLGHILDPRTGWPSRGLSSATVIADRCLVAGGLATAAMVMGQRGAGWLAGLGVRAVLMDEDGRRLETER